MISAQQVSKSYGVQKIFEDITFTVHKGEHLGLVGRNGYGKTTLFRLIVGEEEPDSGSISIPRGYRIGRIAQHMDFTQNTILEEGCLGLPVGEKDAHWKVEKILMGLGFSTDDFSRSIDEFSGGYQMRLLLAKVLASQPDMLLLDEPTNFLDIVSIRWLEQFLDSWRGEIIVISHDRTFMDNVTTHIMGIHRKNLKKIEGKTKDYYGQLAFEEEAYERSRINAEKKKKQLKQYITKFRAKARHGSLVQSRIKTIARMGEQAKLDPIQTLSFKFGTAEIPPKTIMHADNLRFSYSGDAPFLIDEFNISVAAGDKICIIGKNGKGKTTLIKLLAGDLKPVGGRVRHHPKCEIACYEQAHTADLTDTNTIEQEILAVANTGDAGHVRNVCGGMMFSGDLMQKQISVLSGGEKCRVMLGKLLVSQHNLLLLDEPTQHLDIESCDAIIDAVQEFKGASIIVTHDERFLFRVATKLVAFRSDGALVFPGTYEEFLERVGWEDEIRDAAPTMGQDASKETVSSSPEDKKLSSKEIRRLRAEFNAAKNGELKPAEKRVRDIEKEIEENESVLDRCNGDMLDAVNAQESARIQELSKEIHGLKISLEALYDEWAHAHDEFERLNKKYEKPPGE